MEFEKYFKRISATSEVGVPIDKPTEVRLPVDDECYLSCSR
jgi:hypothetical protein